MHKRLVVKVGDVYCNVYRSLRCDRVTLQVHLMLSLLMRSVVMVIITEPFIFQRTENYRTLVRKLEFLLPSVFGYFKIMVNFAGLDLQGSDGPSALCDCGIRRLDVRSGSLPSFQGYYECLWSADTC